MRRTGTVALIVSGTGDAFAGRVFAHLFFGRVVNGVVGYLRARMMRPVLLLAESEAARTQVRPRPRSAVHASCPGDTGQDA